MTVPHQRNDNYELIDGLGTVEPSKGQTVVVRGRNFCGIYQAISFEDVNSSSGDVTIPRDITIVAH